jgi:enoyl-CoA hydratase/carnithine racemase
MSATPKDEVLIRREGRAGRITMNRPRALNALTHAMVAPIWDALQGWRDDAGVELVLLDGSGERALCARSTTAAAPARAPRARFGATNIGSTP